MPGHRLMISWVLVKSSEPRERRKYMLLWKMLIQVVAPLRIVSRLKFWVGVMIIIAPNSVSLIVMLLVVMLFKKWMVNKTWLMRKQNKCMITQIHRLFLPMLIVKLIVKLVLIFKLNTSLTPRLSRSSRNQNKCMITQIHRLFLPMLIVKLIVKLVLIFKLIVNPIVAEPLVVVILMFYMFLLMLIVTLAVSKIVEWINRTISSSLILSVPKVLNWINRWMSSSLMLSLGKVKLSNQLLIQNRILF